MQIATWNVNSIRSRLDHVTQWLQTRPVDVLCLQETKVVDDDFPRSPLEELGYHCYVLGQKSYNGVALLSREPLASVAYGFGDILDGGTVGEGDDQKRVISGVYQGVRIINVYVPNGSSPDSDKYAYKLDWFKLLQTYLQTLRASNIPELCLCGDFNVAPEDRDIHDPVGKDSHIMATPTEREILNQTLAIADLKDSFRQFISDGGHYSWWDYRTRGFLRNRGWRIDHIYLTPHIASQAQRCWIDAEPRGWEKPSDHAPVLVELSLDI